MFAMVVKLIVLNACLAIHRNYSKASLCLFAQGDYICLMACEGHRDHGPMPDMAFCKLNTASITSAATFEEALLHLYLLAENRTFAPSTPRCI